MFDNNVNYMILGWLPAIIFSFIFSGILKDRSIKKVLKIFSFELLILIILSLFIMNSLFEPYIFWFCIPMIIFSLFRFTLKYFSMKNERIVDNYYSKLGKAFFILCGLIFIGFIFIPLNDSTLFLYCTKLENIKQAYFSYALYVLAGILTILYPFLSNLKIQKK